MSEPWKLKRTAQCAKCPWRVDVDPRDIPGGYCETKHAELASTIATPGDFGSAFGVLRVMACHETGGAHCVGWVHNQAGEGNNIGLRLRLSSCTNVDRLRLRGEQHPTFKDTLP
jgi:hypothetical protein